MFHLLSNKHIRLPSHVCASISIHLGKWEEDRHQSKKILCSVSKRVSESEESAFLQNEG